jgi:uncharacterized protein YoxC
MTDHAWVIILSLSFLVMTLTFIAVMAFVIIAAVEMRRASIALRGFLSSTEERIKPVIENAEESLIRIKVISDDISRVSGNVRDVSAAVTELVVALKTVTAVVTGVQEGLALQCNGIKAGFRTALSVFLHKLKEGR